MRSAVTNILYYIFNVHKPSQIKLKKNNTMEINISLSPSWEIRTVLARKVSV